MDEHPNLGHPEWKTSLAQICQDAVIGVDSGNVIRAWNRRAGELFGYAPSEVVGGPIAVLAFAKLSAVREALTASVTEFGPVDSTVRGKNGEIVAVAANAVALPAHKNGPSPGFWLTLRPAEPMPGRSELLDAAVANFPNGSFYLFDADSRSVAVGGQGLAQIGLTSERLLGWTARQICDLMPDGDAIMAIHEAALRGTQGRSELVLQDRIRSIQIVPLPSPGSGVMGILTITQDITEEKEAKEALRREKEFVTGVLDTIACLVVVLDRQSRVVRFNKACEDLTGYSFAEVVGRRSRDMFVGTDEDAGVAETFAELVSGHYPNFHENHWSTRDGRRRLIQWSNTAHRGADGEVEFVIATGIDITEKRASHNALRAAHAELRLTNEGLEERVRARTAELAATNEALLKSYRETEAASQAKTEFLSRISHELRTPMNSILGFAQLIEMRAGDDRDRESVEFIIQSGKRLLELIDSVLDISGMEKGSVGFRLEPVPLDGAVELALHAIRTQAAKKRLTVRLSVAGWEGVRVLSSSHRLDQALGGVLAAIMEFAETGGTLEVVPTESASGTVALLVRASGAGIPLELVPRLFRPFDWLTSADGVAGCGVYLPLARSLVTAMGGSLTVDPDQSGGACLRMELRVASRASGSPEDAVPGDGRPVAVCANSDPAHAEMLAHALGRFAGVRVISITRGKEALEIARRLHPAIVVINDDLADQSLDACLRHFASDDGVRAIPLLAMGDEPAADCRRRMLATGAREYFEKPVQLQSLIPLVRELVTSKLV